MNKPRPNNWKTPTILLGISICAIGLYVQRPREREYQGKRLTEWLDDLDSRGSKEAADRAKDGLRQMGTNAVLPLLEILTAKAYVSKRQGTAQASQTEQYQHLALQAFQALGPVAIPVLTNFLKGETATPTARALSQINPEGSRFLIQALTNSDPTLRQKIELGIESKGPDGLPFVPHLITNLKEKDDLVRAYAARALGKIGVEPEVVVPALIQSLQDANAEVRLLTAQALGEYGPRAQGAILPLLETTKDKQGAVSRAAYAALKQIAPDAAAKAGVKP